MHSLFLNLSRTARFSSCRSTKEHCRLQNYIILNLSPNIIAKCCEICPQLENGIVHFLRMFRQASSTGFSKDVSVGKTPLVFVIRFGLHWVKPFGPSIQQMSMSLTPRFSRSVRSSCKKSWHTHSTLRHIHAEQFSCKRFLSGP